jgi:uncharacterized SAM-binding protein YcdF (DUF218 family)
VLLFSGVHDRELRAAGVSSSAELLCLGGVPRTAIVHDTTVATTYDEARRVSDLVGVRSVTVVTDWYHSRRAALTLRRAVRGRRTSIAVVSPPVPELAVREFWRDPDAVLDVLGEYVALALYRLLGRT